MYQAKEYLALKGLEGLSEQILENHFTLYQGYVANANKDLEKLNQLLSEGKETENEYMELKRRLGWELDGMRLHELYFSNLRPGGKALDKSSSLAVQIETDFGSLDLWEKDFRATAMIRGIGWVILYYDKVGKRLMNLWINEHDVGHLAGAEPILVADVFEHAYMLDYGTKKAGYVDAFLKNACWETAAERFNLAK